MKMQKNLVAMLLALLLVITGCSTTAGTQTEVVVEQPANTVATATAAPAPAPVVEANPEAAPSKAENTIVSVSKYGNCMTSLDYATLENAGIQIGDVFTVTLGNITFSAPVVTNYSDVDLGKFLIKADESGIELAINMGNLAKAAGIEAGAEFTYSLEAKGAYADEYMIRHLEKSEERADYASDEVFANFRAVKAGSIKQGNLYRSSNPILGDARAPYSASLAEEAGIRTVINLADSSESAEKNLGTAPYYASLYNEGRVITLDMGVDFYSEDFAAKLAEGLRFIAQNGKTPILVHCNEGKDRAGVVVALLEALSGATMDEIVEDYMISFENYYGVEKGSEKYEKISNVIRDYFKAINNNKEVGNKEPFSVAVSYCRNVLGLELNEITNIRFLLKK
jgi:Uncharacterized conserved protein